MSSKKYTVSYFIEEMNTSFHFHSSSGASIYILFLKDHSSALGLEWNAGVVLEADHWCLNSSLLTIFGFLIFQCNTELPRLVNQHSLGDSQQRELQYRPSKGSTG